MKKFLFLAIALVVSVCGAWAAVISNASQLENTAIYSIKSVDRGYMICVDGIDALCGTTRKGVTYDANDKNHQWALISYNNKYYMYNVGQKKFVNFKSTDNSDPTCLSPLPLSQGMTFKASTGANASNYPLVIAIDGNHEFNMSSDQGPGVLTSWNSTSDKGNTLAIEKIGEFDPTEALGVLNGSKALQVQNVATNLFLNVKEDATKATYLGTDPEGLYFTAVDGGFEIKDADNNYVGGHSNTWNMSSSIAETWTIEKVPNGFAFKSKTGGNDKYMGFDSPVGEGSVAYRDKNYSSKSGVFIIEDYGVAPTVRVAVTYKINNFKNEEIDVVVENVPVGTEATNPITNGYFTGATFTEPDLVISEENKTFHVTGSWNFPIEESKFYTMHSLASANNYVCNGTNAWYNNSVTVAENNDVWQFAHVAGTLDLFTVKNYGHDKYAVLSGSGRNACTFASEPTVWNSGTGATSYFRVVKQNGGFNLQHPGDAETNVGSHVDNKFGSWKASGSPTNGASINVVTETTPIVPAAKANVTYKYVVDGKEIAKTVTNEQAIGENVAAQPLTINANYATVSDDREGKTVAADGSTVVTVTVTQNLPFEAYNGEGLPKFALLNVHSNQARILYSEYDGEGNGKLWDTTGEIYRGEFNETGRVYNWSIEGNVVEGFKLSNGMHYVNVTAGNQATLSEEATIFDLRPTTAGVGARNFKKGFCLAIAGSNNFLNAQTKIQNGERTTGVKTWTSADEGSTFEFEYAYDITFHANGQGYATLFYHSPLQLPEGVTAYSLERNGDYLVATELPNRFVPSATGVVLKGEAGASITATVTTAYGNAAIADNALSGRYVNGTNGINENTYVFSIAGEPATPGFYKFGGTTLAEFKAYYQAPTSAVNGFVLDFGGLTTGINAAQQAQSQKASFDLQGRRVSKAVRGLFIQNGQKVIR